MSYQSPFTTRYASNEMRAIWSEIAKRRAWRRVWVCVAEAQTAAGLISAEQMDDLRSQEETIDLKRAAEIEGEIGHDLVAELRTFAEQSLSGGAVLHWGLTSADVQDNAEILRQKAALALLLDRLRSGLLAFAARIEETHDLPVLGYTHLQPAEPTTLGYRLAGYAQDLNNHFDHLLRLHKLLRGKGIRGAVGTAGPFTDMLKHNDVTPEMLEATVMKSLGFEAHLITSQTYPRSQDYDLVSALGGLAASLHKVAFDMRLMQSPGFSVLQEPFGSEQVGSSAMPFKRNPIGAEKICSLAREVSAWTQVAWNNAANQLLERTLDDSANRRSMLPEIFLASDEMLITLIDLIGEFTIDDQARGKLLAEHGPFLALERVLTLAVQAGGDRQKIHEKLRKHSMKAIKALQKGRANPLVDLVAKDQLILKYLQPARIKVLLDSTTYTGLASQRALELANRIRSRFNPPPKEK
jgi:adenylosuccinate lyase